MVPCMQCTIDRRPNHVYTHTYTCTYLECERELLHQIQHGVDDSLTPQQVRKSTHRVETELLITVYVGELHRGWK